MEVTEVRVKLADNRDEKLQAFCTITFENCFVIRDVKIIKGARGPFVAMPSRKLTDVCPRCRSKNHLRAHFCNECGSRLPPDRAELDPTGRAKLFADIVHPIQQGFRNYLHGAILEAYEREVVLASQPGYKPPSDHFPDAGEEGSDDTDAPEPERPQPPPGPRPDGNHHRRFGEGIVP